MSAGAKKRVLIFATNYLPFVGGAEIAVKEITDRLPGISFNLIAPRFRRNLPSAERVGNVDVCRVGFGFSFDKFLLPFLGFFKAAALSRREPFDLFWSIMASQGSIAASLAKSLRKKVPLLLTLQEGDPETHLARYVGGSRLLYIAFVRPWHRMVFRRADRVTVISEALRDRARRGGVRVPVDVVPNGVDIGLFSRPVSQDERARLSERLGKKDGSVFLITVSRLVRKNAVDDCIRALSFLGGNAALLVAGSGPDESALKTLARKEGVAERVLFLGEVPHRELPAYLAISDIFVRPSRSEGLGNAFLEAMAAGVPVIGTPVGGIVDFLKDKETGLLAGVGDPKDIALKVGVFLRDGALRESVRAAAKKLVAERYSWPIIAEEMRTVFAALYRPQ